MLHKLIERIFGRAEQRWLAKQWKYPVSGESHNFIGCSRDRVSNHQAYLHRLFRQN